MKKFSVHLPPMIDKSRISLVVFDWGDTLMRDYDLAGPMWQWERVDLLPGVKETLEVLSGRFPLAVATSATHSNVTDMKKALDRVHIGHYFSHMFSAVELQIRKPDPRFFLRVLHAAGTKPSEAVMVGNSYKKDIEGAKKAGLQTVWFNEKKLEGAFPSADEIVFTMNELPHILL